jgi:D-galactarolactone isomerase
MKVPNSGGTSLPRYETPPQAADCHVHVYDPRFPMMHPDLRATTEASVAELRLLQARLETTRVVVVQPAAYGTDNRVTLDAIAQVGLDTARGIAVVHPDVMDEELEALDAGGIRGLRFTQHEPRTAVTTPEMIEPLARRIQAHGWHTQLHLRGEQLVAMAGLVDRLPGTVVIDHMGRVPQPEGVAHPAFDLVRRWIDTGRFWVKLTGPYLESRSGSPRYADCAAVAKGLLAHAPERCVWGSDWPHPTEPTVKPDDAQLIDLLAEWAGSEELRRKVLVDNPAILYGFQH